jgi:hypothetical protein
MVLDRRLSYPHHSAEKATLACSNILLLISMQQRGAMKVFKDHSLHVLKQSTPLMTTSSDHVEASMVLLRSQRTRYKERNEIWHPRSQSDEIMCWKCFDKFTVGNMG